MNAQFLLRAVFLRFDPNLQTTKISLIPKILFANNCIDIDAGEGPLPPAKT